MVRDESLEIVNIYKTHARKLAGGRSFDTSTSGGKMTVMCDLSDDYYYDCKLEGTKMSMVYDLSENTFKITCWDGPHGYSTPMVKFEDPENIGEQMDSLLAHVRAMSNIERIQSWDKKGKGKGFRPLVRLRIPRFKR